MKNYEPGISDLAEILEGIHVQIRNLEKTLLALKKDSDPQCNLIKQEMIADLKEAGVSFIAELEDLNAGYNYRYKHSKEED